MKGVIMDNVPVYNFLGYVLLEASLKQANGNQPQSVFVKLDDSKFDSEKGIYLINIITSLKYSEVESVFKFEAAFEINEQKWLEEVGQSMVDSIFMATAFPYIRSKIFDITSDVRPGVFLPTIDMRQADVYKGVTFTLKSGK